MALLQCQVVVKRVTVDVEGCTDVRDAHALVLVHGSGHLHPRVLVDRAISGHLFGPRALATALAPPTPHPQKSTPTRSRVAGGPQAEASHSAHPTDPCVAHTLCGGGRSLLSQSLLSLCLVCRCHNRDDEKLINAINIQDKNGHVTDEFYGRVAPVSSKDRLMRPLTSTCGIRHHLLTTKIIWGFAS